MRITSDGKIQAQTSGGYYLTENTTNAFSITSNGANGHLAITDEYNSAERMRIDSSGLVEIKNTTPTLRLTNTQDPLGNGTVGILEFFTNDSSAGATRTVSSIVCDNQAGSSVPGGDLVFKTSLGGSGSPVATEKLRIKDNGNVGIGTDDPDEKLVLYKPLGYSSDSALYSVYAVNSTAVDNNKVYKWRTGITGNNTGHSLTFSTLARTESSYVERMRITSGGNLELTDGLTQLTRGSNGNQIALLTHTGTVPYGMQVRYTGASPNTTDNYFFIGSDSSANRIIIWGNGNIQNSNNSYGAISDEKLKENIVDATPKLDDLMKVKVRNYNLIGDDKNK